MIHLSYSAEKSKLDIALLMHLSYSAEKSKLDIALLIHLSYSAEKPKLDIILLIHLSYSVKKSKAGMLLPINLYRFTNNPYYSTNKAILLNKSTSRLKTAGVGKRSLADVTSEES